ncbi:MAG: hypothetical protein HY247_03005 [archaeon]|nr:MAG: hypothetical protein HY247_03005 [archaeon]
MTTSIGERIPTPKVTRSELPVIRIGRKIGDAEIERLISEAAAEVSG